jgi:hypothetical protein
LIILGVKYLSLFSEHDPPSEIDPNL